MFKNRILIIRESLQIPLSRVILLCLIPFVFAHYLLFPSSALASPVSDYQQQQPLHSQEIRYHLPEASEVFLAWGVNNWNLPPQDVWPEGTVVRENILLTPMVDEDGVFTATIQLPEGTTIDYNFQITRIKSGQAVDIWDANGTSGQGYHTTVSQSDAVDVVASLTVSEAPPLRNVSISKHIGGLILLVLGFGVVFAAQYVRLPAASGWDRLVKYINPDIVKIVAFIIATQALLLFIGYFSIMASENPDAEYIPFDTRYLEYEMYAFDYADVDWYVSIAEGGYETRPFSLDRHANWGFYPLYPLMLRVSQLFQWDIIAWGILISEISFILGAIFLYKLLVLDFSRSIALWSVMLLVSFPAAYFFARPGPEAVFLLLSVTAFYLARKKQWLFAGVLGGLLTLTRLQGMFIILPIGYLYYRHYRETRKHDIQILALAFIPLAQLAYMFLLYQRTGNLFASFDIQKVFTQFAYPFASMIKFLSDRLLLDYYGWDLNALLFIFLFLSVIVFVKMIKDVRIPREYVIYTGINVLVIISRNYMDGGLRYLLPVFPLFLMIAVWLENKKMAYSWVIMSFGALQAFYFAAFVHLIPWAAT
jgi:Gpi18-like mannosyltransferase